MKKYELTDETKDQGDNGTLHRIRALRDIPSKSVKAGDFGGWVESESNLSHDGDCWVFCDAKVSGHANVSDDAIVCGNAEVRDDAIVCGNAEVRDEAVICGCAVVRNDAKVFGHAKVRGNALVRGNAAVCGNAEVRDVAIVRGNAVVCDEAVVCGNAEVRGEAVICCDAEVCARKGCITLENTWSSGRTFTYTRSNRKWKVGCFCGTGEELVAKAYKDSKLSGRCYEASVKYVEEIYRILEGGAE